MIIQIFNELLQHNNLFYLILEGRTISLILSFEILILFFDNICSITTLFISLLSASGPKRISSIVKGHSLGV